jgi:hypothetical protein
MSHIIVYTTKSGESLTIKVKRNKLRRNDEDYKAIKKAKEK